MSEQVQEPQPDSAALIDALADYYAMRGAGETKAEMVEKLTSLSEEKLRAFADMTMAEVAKQAEKPKSSIVVPRRRR